MLTWCGIDIKVAKIRFLHRIFFKPNSDQWLSCAPLSSEPRPVNLWWGSQWGHLKCKINWIFIDFLNLIFLFRLANFWSLKISCKIVVCHFVVSWLSWLQMTYCKRLSTLSFLLYVLHPIIRTVLISGRLYCYSLLLHYSFYLTYSSQKK